MKDAWRQKPETRDSKTLPPAHCPIGQCKDCPALSDGCPGKPFRTDPTDPAFCWTP